MWAERNTFSQRVVHFKQGGECNAFKITLNADLIAVLIEILFSRTVSILNSYNSGLICR